MNFKDQLIDLFILNYLTLCSIKRCIPYSLKDANGEHNKCYKTNEAEEKKTINQLNEIRITLLWRQSCVEGVLFDKETNQMLYCRYSTVEGRVFFQQSKHVT